MQTNDQTSSTDESGTAKSAETDSKPNGLVKTLLDSVLEGKDAVVVKADSTAQDQEETAHGQNDKDTTENPDKP